MADQLKELIEKIQQEGFQAAQEKALTIENEAKRAAEQLLSKAQQEADRMLEEARSEIGKMQQGSEAALKQAARDIKLNLRAELTAVLDNIIRLEVKKSLGPEELAHLLHELVKAHGSSAEGKIEVSLNTEDVEKLQHGFLEKLQHGLKSGITLRASEDIQAGFTISFDAGRSQFDFTDQALTGYIAQLVKPKLASLL